MSQKQEKKEDKSHVSEELEREEEEKTLVNEQSTKETIPNVIQEEQVQEVDATEAGAKDISTENAEIVQSNQEPKTIKAGVASGERAS